MVSYDRSPRDRVISRVAGLIARRAGTEPFLVGIDGMDAAGKTAFADELAAPLGAAGMTVVRASVEGFHHPAPIRQRRSGEDPARSYYEDSFDYPALRRALLDPLGPDGTRQIRTRVSDARHDARVEERPRVVPHDVVLLFDGVFLLRPELRDCWDLTVFLAVRVGVALERALDRDEVRFGTAEETARRYRRRYIPGQELYARVAKPEARADVLIDNDDLAAPRIVRFPE